MLLPGIPAALRVLPDGGGSVSGTSGGDRELLLVALPFPWDRGQRRVPLLCSAPSFGEKQLGSLKSLRSLESPSGQEGWEKAMGWDSLPRHRWVPSASLLPRLGAGNGWKGEKARQGRAREDGAVPMGRSCSRHRFGSPCLTCRAVDGLDQPGSCGTTGIPWHSLDLLAQHPCALWIAAGHGRKPPLLSALPQEQKGSQNREFPRKRAQNICGSNIWAIPGFPC